MIKVKILGAGSIGNHLCNAARHKGWHVTLCDVDAAALERTRTGIYPSRYGAWDDAIELRLSREAPRGGYDFIFVGTPPDSHVALARSALEEAPAAILVEKPFATPDLTGCQDLYLAAQEAGVRVFVGYDHVVARSVGKACELAAALGPIVTVDVGFREHWQGIFKAHPWLDGPAASYLGYWRRGGGALGEHSHAANLWQHLAHSVNAGRVVEAAAMLDYVEQGGAAYDRIALLQLRTESGMIGTVAQDVVTLPPSKSARIQGRDGMVEWNCQSAPYADWVRLAGAAGPVEERFEKTRPDDFIQELDHIARAVSGGESSPISIDRGLDTMLVIAAGHLSAQSGRKVGIDYSRGYVVDALSLC